jgi:DNA-binding winged helix-turn-helix (wHTH) protein
MNTSSCSDASHHLTFGPFRFAPATGELWGEDGEPVELQPQPTRLLALLIERSGRLVSREEAREHLWGDAEVDVDSGLAFALRKVRRALGDDPEAPRFVETVPRRGYRFLAEVHPDETLPAGDPEEHGGRSFRNLWGFALAALLLTLASFGAGLGRQSPEPREAEPTVEIDPARDAWLRGRYLLHHGGPEDRPTAARLFRQALFHDPNFALAYVGLEAAGVGSLSLAERLELLDKARRLDPDLPELLNRSGWIDLLERYRPGGARESFERLLAADPQKLAGYHGAALAHAAVGDLESSLHRLHQALARDPAITALLGDAAVLYFWAEQPERGLLQAERALELEPHNEVVRWSVLTQLVHAGRTREAVEQVHHLMPSLDDHPDPVEAYFRHTIEEVLQIAAQATGKKTAGCLAESHLALGEHREALHWLLRAEQEGWYGLTFLGIEPRWDPLRGEPEFQALLGRLGIEDHRLGAMSPPRPLDEEG